MRGKITGPEFAATARILPPEDWPWARKTVKRKYWLARIPFSGARERLSGNRSRTLYPVGAVCGNFASFAVKVFRKSVASDQSAFAAFFVSLLTFSFALFQFNVS